MPKEKISYFEKMKPFIWTTIAIIILILFFSFVREILTNLNFTLEVNSIN